VPTARCRAIMGETWARCLAADFMKSAHEKRAGRISGFIGVALLGFSLHGAAMAQTPDDPARAETVSWTVQPQTAAKPDGRLTLTLYGAVLDGWHVYALKQAPDGPTPLLVTLDANTVATADGSPAGSPPRKIHDPAFDLDTQFYSNAFTVTLPVRLKHNLSPGQQAIPLSVRFQTCNGRTCQPPKTVQLSAPVNLSGRWVRP
jgi:hypothetical protein